MGVQGLTTFIDENPQLLTDHKLHDCPLVIDGNNVYHFIYYRFKVSHRYGGDYDTFAACIRLFFNTLRSCDIKPVVVFDGGYDPSDRKLKTVLTRLSERIRMAGELSSGRGGNVMPLLGGDTFRHELDNLGIQHVTCEFEADSEIAALANEWNCPVLTNDSDFFIYPLKAGYVLLDYLNFTVCESQCADGSTFKHLNVQIFYQKDLLRVYNNMDSSMLALFATLLGNDNVDPVHFEAFFTAVTLPRMDNSKLFTSGRHSKKARLLSWLETKRNVEDAVSTVLGHIKKDKRDSVEQLIHSSLDLYMKFESRLSCYCNTDSIPSEETTILGTDLKTYKGGSFPGWFVDCIHKGKMQVQSMDTLTLHRVILLPQVEILSLPSAHECALDIRKILYGILFTAEEDLECSCGNKGNGSHKRCCYVEERERDGRGVNAVAKKTEPTFQLPNGTPVPHLHRMQQYTERERLEFLYSTLGLSVSELVPAREELQLCLSVVIFWARGANPAVTSIHVLAILTCIICLMVIDKGEQGQKSLRNGVDPETFNMEVIDGDKGKLGSEQVSESAKKAQKNFDKYFQPPKHDKFHLFQSTIIHSYAQFQACLAAALHLNRVLLCPVADISPSQIFNGTFLYNLTNELFTRVDPKLYVLDLLGRSSIFANILDTMYSAVMNQAPLCREAKGHRSRKKEKKKQREKERKINKEDANKEEDGCERSDQFQGAMSVLPNPNNRFAGLLIEDD